MQMRMNCHHQFVFGGIFVFGHKIQTIGTEYSESIPIFRYEIQMYDFECAILCWRILAKIKIIIRIKFTAPCKLDLNEWNQKLFIFYANINSLIKTQIRGQITGIHVSINSIIPN